MNAKQLIASVVLLGAAGVVLAQSTEYETPNANFVSTKTRAEVVAELKQAQADGSFVAGGEEYLNQNERVALVKAARPVIATAAAPVAGKSRAEVVAELVAAKAEGSYVTGGYEYAEQLPVMANGIRNRAEAIESATNAKSSVKANGG